ncbi:MAG: UxaA family hydrolase, partial [bacterium]
VPASLCSGQIAGMIADRLNDGGAPPGVSRVVALVHTEGCGCGGGAGDAERLFLRTIAGHLCHPLVKKALVLEHGCEKTVNDYIGNYLEGEGIDPARFGWASVQMDGGIEKAVGGAVQWFQRELAEAGEDQIVEASAADLRVALLAIGRPGEPQARALAMVARTIAGAGGTVIVPANAPLLEPGPFVEELLATGRPAPTLAYGQMATRPGLHVMETPTRHPVETISGLGATGAEVMVAHLIGAPLPGHPMIPLIQVSGDKATLARWPGDLDGSLEGEEPAALAEKLLDLLCRTASREYTPKLFGQGGTDFQLTRGLLGISL